MRSQKNLERERKVMTNVEIIRINYSVFMAPLFEQATSPIYQFIMSKNDRIRARTIKMRARASVSQGDKWEKRMRCKLSLELIRWLVMALTYLLSLTFCRHRCLSPVVVSFICFFFLRLSLASRRHPTLLSLDFFFGTTATQS